jgi:prolyl-tRNA synthetase
MVKKTEHGPERLPDRSDFIKWYNSLLELAEIADRSYPVKGTFVWMPYGMQLMKNIVAILDRAFQEHGIEETQFPLFVPMEFAKQNENWFEGFKDEAFYTAEKELLLRPTGEPAMYPIFKLWIKKGKMPIKIYETISSYRNESKTTHTLIRDREITFWHEIHTVHKTRDESLEEADTHKAIYDSLWIDALNIPPISVSKPKYEIFAGAESAYEFYTILPDGRLLENGSINNLGQAYAKKFDLYIDNNGSKEYVWQVCTGNGARTIAAVISIHGDDKGLVVPPKIAPLHIVIIPVFNAETEGRIKADAHRLMERLKDSGLAARVDESDASPGEKFNIWELKGVPIRIEIGMKELEGDFYTLFRRDTCKKEKVEKLAIIETAKKLIQKDIPENLIEKAAQRYKNVIKYVFSIEEAKIWISSGGVAKANWCEDENCFDSISAIAPSVEAVGTLTDEEKEGVCIVCGKKSKKLTLFGRTY